MIEQFRLPLDTEPQSAKGPRIGRDDAATFAPLWKPQPLIRVIASAKTDFVRTIGSEHALEHVHRKQGAKRHTVEPLIVRQFANDRAAVPHDPELYGHWNPVDIVDAEAQRLSSPRSRISAGTNPGNSSAGFQLAAYTAS